MAKVMPIPSPFTSCEKGHDLTREDSYMYDASNRKMCRQCAKDKGVGGTRRRRAKGSFS